MKLTLQQKIALVISVLWAGPFLISAALAFNSDTPILILAAIMPPWFVLWISGALKPLLSWFRGQEQ